MTLEIVFLSAISNAFLTSSLSVEAPIKKCFQLSTTQNSQLINQQFERRPHPTICEVGPQHIFLNLDERTFSEKIIGNDFIFAIYSEIKNNTSRKLKTILAFRLRALNLLLILITTQRCVLET